MREYFLNYIRPIKDLLIVCFLIFLFSVLGGYFSAQNSPQQAEEVLERLREMYEPIGEIGPFGQFVYVILNNSLVIFFSILLGLFFGIIPLFSLFSNGAILGILMYLFQKDYSLGFFLAGIIPHGILEIPVLILGCAMGVKLGREVIKKLFQKKGNVIKELSSTLEFFWKIIIPLLILAAAIEIFITDKIMEIYPF